MPSFTSAWAGGVYILVSVPVVSNLWDATSRTLIVQGDGDCAPAENARTFSNEGRCFHAAFDGRCIGKVNGARPDGLIPRRAWCWTDEKVWDGKKEMTPFMLGQLIRSKVGEQQLQGEQEAWAVAEAVRTLQDLALPAEEAAAACGRIGEVLRNLHTADWMIDFGAIDAVIAVSRRMLDNKVVVKSCAGTMAAFCPHSGLVGYASSSFAKESGLALMDTIWRRYPEDAPTLVGAATRCFLRHDDGNKQFWREKGGVELILQAARANLRDPDTLAQLLSVLSADVSAPSAERFIKAGGFELAAEAIRTHPPPKGGQVGEMAMQLVRTVLYQKELRKTLAPGSYIRDVVQAMRGAGVDYYTLAPACSNLMLLSLDNSTHLAQAIEEGAALTALSAAVRYPDTEDDFSWDRSLEFAQTPYRAYEDCLQFLALAVRDCGARKALNEAGAVEAVSGALTKGAAKIRRLRGDGIERDAWLEWMEFFGSKLQEEPCAEE